VIKKIKIQNFKCFKDSFVLEFKEGVNILVGNNETGKSTILEAIHLALTGTFRGKSIRGNLTPYLFNYEVVKDYLDSVNEGNICEPPEVLIELYLEGNYHILEGDKFTEDDTKAQGVSFRIALNEDYREEYNTLLLEKSIRKTEDEEKDKDELGSLPVEYYDIEWFSFARKALTLRSIPVKSSLIDVGFSKFQNGSDIYISRIVQNILETGEKIKIAQAYRKVKESFAKEESIKDINSKITDISDLSKKSIELTVDLSSKSTWDGSLITQLDNIPFDFIGKGEQAIIKTDLALSQKQAESSPIILIEEPECHISHTRLNQLLESIKTNYNDKQIILSTHSSFVSNKLGLDNLILLSEGGATARFNALKSSTKKYFEKISGYDTLRLILCKKAILVEGDSDELILQRAYMDLNNGRLPIEDGIEIISVGTSFLRFLEVATTLNHPVAVVTDNDGDIEALEKKYACYIGENAKEHIAIFYDEEEHKGNLKVGKSKKPFNYNTLEPALFRANTLKTLNSIFETEYDCEDDMHKYMRASKTECALAIFDSKKKISYPEYIVRAIS